VEEIEELIQALQELKKNNLICQTCFNVAEKNPCSICSDTKRDQKTICIVAETHDLASLEATSEYTGLYHVLGGTLNPLAGITPEKLRIKELLARLKTTKPQEIIFALNPDMEGESTVLYLKKLLQPLNIKLTRLARGLPMGADLEYADEVTLINALKNRNQV
jgi:recombination protein RecR